MFHAAANRQDAADALIAGVLDTDQHLARSRSQRLRHVGKLEHLCRFTKNASDGPVFRGTVSIAADLLCRSKHREPRRRGGSPGLLVQQVITNSGES
jgi:hypothetical protein